jgi:uncharacterized membrane protein YhaH (DUF805 family)
MSVGPILVAIAAGLVGIGIAEAVSAPPDEFLAGIEWMGTGMLVGLVGSVWCLVASVIAVARIHDPGRRWGLGLCINLAAFGVVAAFVALTASA